MLHIRAHIRIRTYLRRGAKGVKQGFPSLHVYRNGPSHTHCSAILLPYLPTSTYSNSWLPQQNKKIKLKKNLSDFLQKKPNLNINLFRMWTLRCHCIRRILYLGLLSPPSLHPSGILSLLWPYVCVSPLLSECLLSQEEGMGCFFGSGKNMWFPFHVSLNKEWWLVEGGRKWPWEMDWIGAEATWKIKTETAPSNQHIYNTEKKKDVSIAHILSIIKSSHAHMLFTKKEANREQNNEIPVFCLD